jgi:hypothetical protein
VVVVQMLRSLSRRRWRLGLAALTTTVAFSLAWYTFVIGTTNLGETPTHLAFPRRVRIGGAGRAAGDVAGPSASDRQLSDMPRSVHGGGAPSAQPASPVIAVAPSARAAAAGEGDAPPPRVPAVAVDVITPSSPSPPPVTVPPSKALALIPAVPAFRMVRREPWQQHVLGSTVAAMQPMHVHWMAAIQRCARGSHCRRRC